MRRYLPLTLLLVTIAGLIAAAWVWGDDRVHVVQVVDDQGQPAGDGTAVIIDGDGRPFFFFPFGFLIVPLVVILFVWAFRTAFWRGGPGYAGPGGTPPPWFEDWYRQMQQRAGRRDDSQPPSQPQDREG